MKSGGGRASPGATLGLALRLLRRDWRAGEFAILGLALWLAVAALTSVSFLADRVSRALVVEAHQLLGGDLLLVADHPWQESVRQAARQRGLRIAETATFPSMMFADGRAALAEVKAATTDYPLRGRLRGITAPGAAEAELPQAPGPGEAWAERRLADALGLTPGMPFSLGHLSLRLAGYLSHEPDRGLNPFALAPRLLVSLEDMPASGLIQPASRVSWRMQLAGEPAAVTDFQAHIAPRLGQGERLESLDNARPEIRTVLERAQRFLSLAALLSVMLAAVAVALATDRYMRRHLDGCAVMRCLGASELQILWLHGGEFLAFGLLATLAGTITGYGLQFALQSLLGGLMAGSLPLPGWQPWVQGLAVGAMLLAGFALPPLLRLSNVPTLRVLRREMGAPRPLTVISYGAGLALLALLLFWIAGDWLLGGLVLTGFLLAFAVYGISAWLLISAAAAMARWPLRPGLRLGLLNLRRHRAAAVMQAVAISLGLTALLLLTVARNDLLATWQAKVPADAPNRFVINLQPDQRQGFSDAFRRQHLPLPELSPMVRARLVAVAGKPVTPGDYADERARRLVEREFNLSWMDTLPQGNTVVAGQWHGKGGPQFSVEQELARTLGLAVGDTLSFEVAGLRVAGPITSLRKLEWDSMRVNFFVIAPPGVIENFPASYITAFHLPPDSENFVVRLVADFPNISVIDVAAIVGQLRQTIEQVALAVQALFAFAVAAGMVVLLAALQATRDERNRELAVLRALGALRKTLRQAVVAEFLLLGAIAGALASLGAGLIAAALAHWVFRLPYQPQASLGVAGVLAGMVGLGLAAWIGLGRSFQANVADEMRA